jgi:tripartite-type tricarboxylate transporter receptor subunit TctC
MNPNRRELLQWIAAGSAAWSAPGLVHAQPGWPKAPIKLVVPFTAGSGTDIVGRTVGERLEKLLGQPVVIDNKPGAGGTLGAAAVAAAAPDGYTLLIHSAGHVANAALYPTLKYDTQKDFIPITMLATLPNVLVTSPATGFKSIQELVQKVKAEPSAFTYASAGNGSATHINAEKFRIAAGLRATHVPYRGTPEALTDVMGGRVDWFFAPLVSALPLINDGKLVALAVGSPKRSSQLPQVPTTLEAGFPGSDYTFWVGLFAPAKTPSDVVERLNTETVRVLQMPEVKSRLEKLGADVAPMAQPQFADFVRDEIIATGALIKQAGIRME